MQKNLEIMSKFPVNQAILKLALPTMFAMVVQLIYNITDTFFIGQTGDSNMVAAIALSMPVFMVIQAFGNIYANGSASYISRMLGEKQLDEAKRTSATAFYLAIITGVVLTAVFFIFVDGIVGIIGTSDATYQYTKNYLIIVFAFSIVMILQVSLSGLLRAEGATSKTMIGMFIGTAVNIVLDPVFIFTLNLGVAGAAWATVIGNAFGAVYYLLNLQKGKCLLSIAFRWFKPTKKVLSETFKIGVPSSVTQFVMSVSFVLVNVVAATYGDKVVAANGIEMRLTSMVVMLVIGLAQGFQPFAGYNYGAKQYDRLMKGYKITVLYGTILSLAFMTVFILLGRQIYAAFIQDDEVIGWGVRILSAFIWCTPCFGIQMTTMMTFQATGKALKSMFMGLGRQCILYLPLLFILNNAFGFNGFIFAQPIADILTTVLGIILSISFLKEIRLKHEQQMMQNSETI